MKYLFFCFVLFFGCQESLRDYVNEHTYLENNYGTEELYISINTENPIDFDDSVISDLLWVQQHIAETILPDDDDFTRVTIFLPSTDDSFIEARKHISGTGDNPGVAFIVPESRIVVFRPDTWNNRTLKYIVETYIHELMHYVALRIDGDIDANHLKSEYWGKNGLVSIIFQEWLAK